MKVNQCFLRGFAGGLTGDSDKLCMPLKITGDENSITLTKGDGFDEWLADDTKIVLHDDTKTTYTAQNQEMLRRIVMAWLHGEEFEGEDKPA
jgi:hypothetical protein